MQRNYYMVRAMHSQEHHFKELFENEVVAMGFSYIDFSQYDTSNFKKLWEEVKRTYQFVNNLAPQVKGRKRNEINRFLSIKEDDIILIPYYSWVCIAIAGNEKVYNSEIKDSVDLSNQIKVKFLKNDKGNIKTIPRKDLREDLERRLRVRGATVSNLNEFRDEIDSLFHYTSSSYSIEEKIDSLEKEKEDSFKNNLLQKIQQGKVHIQSGGLGIENLVKELFEIEGYSSQILPKNNKDYAGKADADIKASKTDRFFEKELLIQVKHHAGFTNSEGVKQLKAIQETDNYENTTQLLFLTTGNINPTIQEEAENSGIMTMDGADLVDWLHENINNLKYQTKRNLGISTVPKFLE